MFEIENVSDIEIARDEAMPESRAIMRLRK